MDFLHNTKHHRRLVIFFKEPRPGTVKTRLAKAIGTIAATAWYRQNSLDIIRRLQDSRWQTILAISPDNDAMTSKIWPAHLPRIAQGSGGLGVRMRRVFKTLPPGPVIIIGTDIPRVTTKIINQAFQQIDGHSAIIGPTPDGGYWLIGLGHHRRHSATLFDNVRWSSEFTLTDTLRSLNYTRIKFTAVLNDIDTEEDFFLQ